MDTSNQFFDLSDMKYRAYATMVEGKAATTADSGYKAATKDYSGYKPVDSVYSAYKTRSPRPISDAAPLRLTPPPVPDNPANLNNKGALSYKPLNLIKNKFNRYISMPFKAIRANLRHFVSFM